MKDKFELCETIKKVAGEIGGDFPTEDESKLILGVLLIKWLNDTAEKFKWKIEEESRWEKIKTSSGDLRKVLFDAAKNIEKNNRILEGVFSKYLFENTGRFSEKDYRIILNILDHFDFSKNREILADFIEWYTENSEILERNGRHLDYSTPEVIKKLLVELVDVRNRESIFDLGSGIGGTLVAAVKINPEIKVYGEEIDKSAYYLSMINLIFNGKTNFRIEQGDVLLNPLVDKAGNLLKFDAVLSNFPFGVQIRSMAEILKNDRFNRFNLLETPLNSADWFFIQHAVAVTENKGITALVVTRGSLVKATDERIRRRLIEEDMVEAVIDLPPRLFEITAIPVSILVINKNKPAERRNKVLLIDASGEYVVKNRRTCNLSEEQINKIIAVYRDGLEINAFSRFVGIEEIAGNEYKLGTINYLKVESLTRELGRTVNLKEIAEQIFRGLQLKSTEMDALQESTDSDYCLLNIGDIRDGEIDVNSLTGIKIKNPRWLSLYLLKPGDVIVSGRGSAIKVAVVEEDMPSMIPASNLICIRVNRKKMNPYFLKLYLESNTGKTLLEGVQTGTSIKVLNPGNIENIPVPAVSIEEQDKIAETYRNAWKKYRETIRRAETEFKNTVEEIYRKMGLK